MNDPAPDIPAWAAIIVGIFLIAGAAFTLVGTLGSLKFGTFYERVHAPPLGTNMGTALILVASMVYFTVLQYRPVAHEVLIGISITLTTPVTPMLLLSPRSTGTVPKAQRSSLPTINCLTMLTGRFGRLQSVRFRFASNTKQPFAARPTSRFFGPWFDPDYSPLVQVRGCQNNQSSPADRMGQRRKLHRMGVSGIIGRRRPTKDSMPVGIFQSWRALTPACSATSGFRPNRARHGLSKRP